MREKQTKIPKLCTDLYDFAFQLHKGFLVTKYDIKEDNKNEKQLIILIECSFEHIDLNVNDNDGT